MEKLKLFTCGPNDQKETEKLYKEWILEQSRRVMFEIIQREVSVCSVSSGDFLVDFTTISIFYTD